MKLKIASEKLCTLVVGKEGIVFMVVDVIRFSALFMKHRSLHYQMAFKRKREYVSNVLLN